MVTILFSLRLYWCRVPYPYDLFLLAAPRVSPGAAVFVSSCPRSNNNLSNSRKIVQVTTDDHGFSLGYDADNGLYTLVDLTRFYLVSKSDLFANNYQTNPDLVATPFAAINGFNNAVTNIPDDAKNTWNSLQTIWLFPNEIGDLTKNRLQIIITGNNTSHRRMYESGKFSNWS